MDNFGGWALPNPYFLIDSDRDSTVMLLGRSPTTSGLLKKALIIGAKNQ